MTKKQQIEAALSMLEQIDRWMHCALVLGYLAVDLGLDAQEMNRIVRAPKEEIDKMLIERLKAKERPGGRAAHTHRKTQR